jgi:cbb3-type cytochrome oxidase subunit 1
MGITQSKEYAEPEWYADIWLVIVWVTYFIIYLRTLARRKEPHIYVANWYYMAFILVVAVLHIVNNLAIPVSLGHAKSYSSFSGDACRDAPLLHRASDWRALLPDRGSRRLLQHLDDDPDGFA